MRWILGALAALAATPAAAQPVPAAPDYSQASSWLCLPSGSADFCRRGLPYTTLTAKGFGPAATTRPAADPGIDCFYVYPTISGDPGLNSDLVPGDREEKYVTQYQFARFPEVCRPFVPMYRQMTMAAIAVATTGGDVTQAGMMAYADVAAAFREYMTKWNGGRPFVLIGHSQGAIMLDQLIPNEIEGTPAHDRMLRAYLAGWNLPRQAGADRPLAYKSTPLCASEDQTGCVVTWTTYGEGKAPPAGALFGRAPDGLANSCIHPGQPGAKGWAPLDGFFNTRSTYPVPGGPVRWSATGAGPTAYASAPAFLEARCVENGPLGYLEVRLRRAPGDTRTARIGGEVGQFGIFLPGWGKHLYDISVAHGSILADLSRLGDEVRLAQAVDPLAPAASTK